MSHQIIDINCPGCGARVTIGQNECNYCFGPIVISTFRSVNTMSMPEVNKFANEYRKGLAENPDNKELNTSIAFCFLKLKLYDKALSSFEKAIVDNFDNSEVYFYAAICLLQGNKAFLLPRPVIDKIEEYINAALTIEPKGIYYYFWSYIKFDYYNRKFFNTTPTYKEVLDMAITNGLSDFDKDQLFDVLNVAKPDCL